MPNEITVSSLNLYPSLEIGSVIVEYTGDDNHNASAQVRYRETGGQWRTGVILTNDYRVEWRPGEPNPYRNQFRGCIWGLVPNTVYEVMVTVTDSDGFLNSSPVGVMTTWDENPLSAGNTYWISPVGSDTNDGLSDISPWQTLAKARDTVRPGDTVMIMPGIYSGGLRPVTSGLIDNYITWRSADFNNKAILTYNYHGPFTLSNLSYNRFAGLEVENTSSSGRSCFYFDGPTEKIIIEDCLIRPEGARAYWCAGVCLNNAEANNTIIRRNVFTTQVNGSNEGPFALMRTRKCSGTVFCDNIVDGHFGDAINTGLNFNGHAYRNTIIGVNDDGLELEYDGICCSAFENTITEGLYADIAVASIRHGPTYIMRNIPYGAHRSGGGCSIKQGSSGSTDGWVSTGFVYFYHNAFAPSQVDAIAGNYGGGAIYNQLFRNNIMAHFGGGAGYVVENSNTSSPVPCDFDYNCMVSARYDPIKWLNNRMSWADWRANYGMEQHGVWGDPLFVNIANGDARLQEGSPCIDAGQIIPGINDAGSPWPYGGGAPDIGAIESGIVGVPVAKYSANPESGGAPLLVQFTNESIGAIDLNYWDFGDGGNSIERNPSHPYQHAGLFEATLTVTGPGGEDTFTMTIEVTQTYTLNLAAGAGGTTDPEPGTYQLSGSATLRAIPDSDYRFVRWEEAGTELSTELAYAIFMDGDKNINAVFKYVDPIPGEFEVTIVSLGGGYTSPSGEIAVGEGETLMIEAHPTDGWKLNHWEGDVTGRENPATVLVDRNMTIVAVFKEKSSVGLAIASVGLIVSVIAVAKKGGKV